MDAESSFDSTLTIKKKNKDDATDPPKTDVNLI